MKVYRTAEQILNNSGVIYELESSDHYDLSYVMSLILEAMEEYASQKGSAKKVIQDLQNEISALKSQIEDQYLNNINREFMG